MADQKINLSFKTLTDANFEKKAAFIVESLTKEPAFANIDPSLAVMQAAILRYSVALLAAADLSRNNVAEKNESRLDMEQKLWQAGLSVMNKANGNVKLLVSSGYVLSKAREASYITNPGPSRLINGITTGELTSSVANTPNAKSYLHEITDELPTDKTVWISRATTTSKYTFTGLVVGKQYWVRVGVVGSRGQLAYSTVSTQVVQIIG